MAPRVGDMDSHAVAFPLELGIWIPRFGVAPRVGNMDSHTTCVALLCVFLGKLVKGAVPLAKNQIKSSRHHRAQTQTRVFPNLNQYQCSDRGAMGVGTWESIRRRAAGVGTVWLVRWLNSRFLQFTISLPFLLVHYRFPPLALFNTHEWLLLRRARVAPKATSGKGRSTQHLFHPNSLTPDQVREAIAWINDNARNENGTMGWKKVVDHFITHWGLAGEDVLPNTPSWSALATKVGNTLCHRYRTARGAFKGHPPKRRRTKSCPCKAHS